MALSPFKTYSAGEILTASDLNSSFSQLHDNGISLWSPAVADIDMDGQAIILDADGDTSITADTDDQVDLRIGAVDMFAFAGSGYAGSQVLIGSGAGSPEGAVAAPVGSAWFRTDGGANTTLYIKESGTGNTGWAAM